MAGTTLVLGASGIIGQHMMLTRPGGRECVFVVGPYSKPLAGVVQLDLQKGHNLEELLERVRPETIVNLAGESRPDVVEKTPHLYYDVNVLLPRRLAMWCKDNNAMVLQISTQAVFSGENPPYYPYSVPNPVNAYGRQKREAEEAVLNTGVGSVARLTFVIGVRPVRAWGRHNPAEVMLRESKQSQVNDRFFSPVYARDAAEQLWKLTESLKTVKIYHVGMPISVTRAAIARKLNEAASLMYVSHMDFPGLAARPYNTTYKRTLFGVHLDDAVAQIKKEYQSREDMGNIQLSKEIALFLGMSETDAYKRLNLGFHHHHAAVKEDFTGTIGDSEESLLAWYRRTEAYIWELSAYHSDEGFNYKGMCDGMIEGLLSKNVRKILVLGDGIGTFSLKASKKGLDTFYHDLKGSRTSEFAKFRFQANNSTVGLSLTDNFDPPQMVPGEYDAVVSLDFFEHLPNVETWIRHIYSNLPVGGWLCVQNAFATGSGPDGSIPCHLEVNDHYEHDWVPMMESVGFQMESGNWWRKA